jgi:hypothetical protein
MPSLDNNGIQGFLRCHYLCKNHFIFSNFKIKITDHSSEYSIYFLYNNVDIYEDTVCGRLFIDRFCQFLHSFLGWTYTYMFLMTFSRFGADLKSHGLMRTGLAPKKGLPEPKLGPLWGFGALVVNSQKRRRCPKPLSRLAPNGCCVLVPRKL